MNSAAARDEPFPDSIEALDEQLSRPTQRVVETLASLEGDLLILGVGGKMGPTLARMARRASDAAGGTRRVIGVSRFSSSGLRDQLAEWNIETIGCDLLDESAWAALPDAPNIIYMAGFKFGATAEPDITWAMNCWLPTLACRRFPLSRIAAFSTGNVYGLVPVDSHGSREQDDPQPVGEYAMTTLGRERMLQYFSRTRGTPCAILRLNYATELRYGVLVDIGRKVLQGEPIDLAMGHVNVIWQRDANAMAITSLAHCSSPARIINIAGADKLRVRDVAEQFGKLLGRSPVFVGSEAPHALLNDGRLGYQLLGQPQTTIDMMIAWTSDWLRQGGPLLNKPTHFEAVDGKF